MLPDVGLSKKKITVRYLSTIVSLCTKETEEKLQSKIQTG